MPDLSVFHPHSDGSTGFHAVFPIQDLHFAVAWSRVAPGIGGWQLSVSEMTTGEIVEVIPPGAEFPVFYLLPRPAGVEIIRERVMEVGGGQVSMATVPSLREAVLLLCPLNELGMAELWQVVQNGVLTPAQR